ncbi:MAG TPA: SRPBCC family protein [Solirubrobacteraceae bacterium]|nr:SRPBCC family protein [Solirubrobacteraceae bacterium]
MSTVHLKFDVAPERIWAVLSDPTSYADWVVGSDSIRSADPHWPAPGSRFHHRVGTGPLKVRDHTEVLEADPPHRLVLRARARPLGTARVEVRSTPDGAGTLVSLVETAADPLTRLVLNRFSDSLLDRRNTEMLRRLKRLAESD